MEIFKTSEDFFPLVCDPRQTTYIRLRCGYHLNKYKWRCLKVSSFVTFVSFAKREFMPPAAITIVRLEPSEQIFNVLTLEGVSSDAVASE